MLALLINCCLLLSVSAFSEPADDQAPDVLRAARDYRITVYDRFRLDRPAYEQHRQQGDQLLKAWQEAGRPSEQQQQVVQWYEQAREQLATGKAELPSWPDLSRSEPQKVQEQVADQPMHSEPAAPASDVDLQLDVVEPPLVEQKLISAPGTEHVQTEEPLFGPSTEQTPAARSVLRALWKAAVSQ